MAQILALTEINRYINAINDAVGTEVISLEDEFGQSTLIPIKDVLDYLKQNVPARGRNNWIREPGRIPKCPICFAYSEDADLGAWFNENSNNNGQLIHYCSNCGAYLD